MMDRNTRNRLSISAAAAAVALALGAPIATAQQSSSSVEQDRQQSAQQAQDRARDTADRAERSAERAEDRARETSDRANRAEERAEDAAESQQRRAQSSSSSRQGSSSGDLANLGEEYDDLSTFAEALETAGLIDSLSDGTNYTIFAPTNEAFESMRGDVEDLLSSENREELVDLLRAHIVADDVDATRAGQLQEARTLDGGTVELKTEDGKLMVGDATVVDTDIERGNVRIHTIDEVLDARTRTASVDDDDDRSLR